MAEYGCVHVCTQRYSKGEMMTSEVKARLVQVVDELITKHRVRYPSGDMRFDIDLEI